METEIELKFFVATEFADVLRDKISQTKILQHSCRNLGNTYFDTPDKWLRQHDIGLRIRRVEDTFVQTVKTAGRVVAGLHQRPEFNATHHSNEPLLSLHPADIWPNGRSAEELQNQVEAIFATDFTREQWLIAMPDGSQVEVAFDQGQVVAGGLVDPICEVELELKSGQTDSLFNLARQLSEHGGMRLGNLSKAARGYRLAAKYSGDQVKPLSLARVTETDSVETAMIINLEHALSHWHYHEQIFAERHELAALHEIQTSVSCIRQIFTVFSQVVPRRATALLRQELKWLEQEFTWLSEAWCLGELLQDKGHVLRKLDAKKKLMSLLEEKQTHLPDRAAILSLLESARYTGLILDLSRWILSRAWQPFLDDKSRRNLLQPLKPYSAQQLELTWRELLQAFPVDALFSEQDYLGQQYRLKRNLYTGVCFAYLYQLDERNKFRLPWADLLEGMADLQTLVVVEELVDLIEDQEEKTQIERWLERQRHSILHAMQQTRNITLESEPYWQS